MSDTNKQLGVGMVGYAFMGAAHSQAWRTAGRVFDLPLAPSMTAVCGRNAEAASAAANKLGWKSYETDWRALIARDDIDLVDVCTPGDSHAEIAIAALDAGKHVLCEKPLANTVAEAEAMVAAAERARTRGIRSMVAFNYRRVPALALARQLDRIGPAGRRPPCSSGLPPGLDRRSAVSVGVATAEGQGRLRCARRHRARTSSTRRSSSSATG